MATAVTVTFGANSAQFQSELARMQTMASAAGRRISGGIGGAHGFTGQTGVVRESAVIGREIAMGRGFARILASMTLLAQYINSATRSAKQGVSAAEMLADAYDRESVKARLAAAAALKKAEAMAAEAEMEGFETQETLVNADAQAAEAKNLNLAAIAMEEKALAARQSAAADEAAATAAATASGSFKALLATAGYFALLLIIVAEAYVVFKNLALIINRKAVANKAAAAYAREHKLAIWEEIEAAEKLKDATVKTTEAIRKMNEAKDKSVKLAHAAVEASKAEHEQREKLYDAGVKGKLLDIEIAEKRHAINYQQAAHMKAAVELQAVLDKAKQQQSKLDDEARITAAAADKAEKDKLKAQNKAQAASDKINKSPDGLKRATMLAEAEKNLAASKREAEDKQKEFDEINNRSWLQSTGAYLAQDPRRAAAVKIERDALVNKAATAEIQVNSLKRFMSPDEKAAAVALQKAEERTNSAATLKVEAEKAAKLAEINAKNSPALIAAERAVIKKQEQLDSLPINDAKSYGLNNQQRVGAYAATPPVALQQLNVLRSIDHKVTPAAPPTNHPPGARPPQMGPKPITMPYNFHGGFHG